MDDHKVHHGAEKADVRAGQYKCEKISLWAAEFGVKVPCLSCSIGKLDWCVLLCLSHGTDVDFAGSVPRSEMDRPSAVRRRQRQKLQGIEGLCAPCFMISVGKKGWE